MSSPDPLPLGLLSSTFISLLISIPLLSIFFRIRSRPSSFLWKAIYVPRTWWPSPSQRLHPVFDPFPAISSLKSLFLLILNRSPSQHSSPNLSSTSQSPANLHSSTFLSDDEIHLRFLALCLRLALLALLLGLPTFFALFFVGIPESSPQTNSVQQFTLMRLLYQQHLTPKELSTRLIIWSIFALLIGVLLAFLLILLEWLYLRKNLRRFIQEKCGGLQIVYFPMKPYSGFENVGEKKMANWVRACGLGPVGQEGSGVALNAKHTHQSHQSHQRRHSRKNSSSKKHKINADTIPLRTSSDNHQSIRSSFEAPLPPEKRGIIIQAIFTISHLERLHSLSKKRRKVLDELELNESKYLAAFLPQNLADFTPKKPKQAKNHHKFRYNRFAPADDSAAQQVTPYGPLGMYKLDANPRGASGLGWEDPCLRLSRFESNLSSSTLAESFDREEESQVKDSDFRFGEIFQDLHLTNQMYQEKWAIGNKVIRQDDGIFHDVMPQDEPTSLKSQKSQRSDDQKAENFPPTVTLTQVSQEAPQVWEQSDIHPVQSRTSKLSHSVIGSWAPPRRSTPSSLASTDDTHGYPASTSTAPTSASLYHSNSKQTLRDNDNQNIPAITLTDLIEQEAQRINRLSFPSELTANPKQLYPPTQSVSSPNLAGSPSPEISIVGKGKRNSDGSIIPYLFEIPEGIKYQDSHPVPTLPVPPTNHKIKKMSSPIINKKNPQTAPSHGKVKPHRFMNAQQIEELYHSIRKNRSQLKRLNQDFLAEKRRAVEEMEEGSNGSVFGWILVGKGVELIDGALPIDGMTREDINWSSLGKNTRLPLFWIIFAGIFVIVGTIIILVSILSMTAMPEIPKASSFLASLHQTPDYQLGLISVTAPSMLLFILLYPSLSTLSHLAMKFSGLPSKVASQLLSIKAIFILISGCFVVWFLVCASTIDLVLQTEAQTDVGDELELTDRFSRGILALSDSFLSFQIILAIIVPTLIMTQPGRSKKVQRVLQSTQTPRQRALSLRPQEMNSALCRGATLMAVSILLLFSSVAPLTILPSVVFFCYMIMVQQRNVYCVYKRDSQSGGKMELQMVFMLSILLVLHSIFLAVILASRQQWVLTGLAVIIGLIILTMACLMMYQDSKMGAKRRLHPQSKRALEVFQAGPGGTDYDTVMYDTSKASKSAGPSRKESLHSVFQLLHSKLRSSEVHRPHRPVPLPSESVDHLVDTRLALGTYPDAPPHLPFLDWGSSPAYPHDMLYPPVLLQTSPAVWLPKNGFAAQEAYELKKYWDLDAFYEEGIPTHHLNLL